MVWKNNQNGDAVRKTQNFHDTKSIYSLEHLGRVKLEAEIKKPKDKLKILFELDKTFGICPKKMYMCFNEHWVIILNSNMEVIENFPGALISEPTAFISEDSKEIFNNILVFTVPNISLGSCEMISFQVCDVSAVHVVENLKYLRTAKIIRKDRNNTPPNFSRTDKSSAKDHSSFAVSAAEVAAEKYFQNNNNIVTDVQILNHYFDDIELFVVRLQYAVENLRELELRQKEPKMKGKDMFITCSLLPTKNEFIHILAKYKFAINYVTKLRYHFQDPLDIILNLFVSLQMIVCVCNDVYAGTKIAENVAYPLLLSEAITFLNNHLKDPEMNFWKSLGRNWTQSKERKECARPESSTNSPNPKGLDVTKGEHLEIIDDSRSCWKPRNLSGSIGFVPNKTLSSMNSVQQTPCDGPDKDFFNHPRLKTDNHESANNSNILVSCTSPSEQEINHRDDSTRTPSPRSYAMSNVPIPPPMPPPSDTNVPIGTLKQKKTRNVTMSTFIRNDRDISDELQNMPNTVNDELKLALMQRERRKDLEVIKTAQIYINQQSNSKEVMEWLCGKGFSDIIIEKFSGLNGDELFALPTHVITEYFGEKESRRLLSQILLQKNICEYKTIRSSEFFSKLARARQKVESQEFDLNNVF